MTDNDHFSPKVLVSQIVDQPMQKFLNVDLRPRTICRHGSPMRDSQDIPVTTVIPVDVHRKMSTQMTPQMAKSVFLAEHEPVQYVVGPAVQALKVNTRSRLAGRASAFVTSTAEANQIRDVNLQGNMRRPES